jgi:hypothetical protein
MPLSRPPPAVAACGCRAGGGIDTLDYSDHTQGVVVDLGTLAPAGTDANADGIAEEGDVIAGDLENLNGGQGPDTLAGSAVANTINGGLGDDNLVGRGGPDVIHAGPSHETVDAGPGDDLVDGVDGQVDTLGCGDDNDTAQADTQDVVRPSCEQVN